MSSIRTAAVARAKGHSGVVRRFAEISPSPPMQRRARYGVGEPVGQPQVGPWICRPVVGDRPTTDPHNLFLSARRHLCRRACPRRSRSASRPPGRARLRMRPQPHHPPVAHAPHCQPCVVPRNAIFIKATLTKTFGDLDKAPSVAEPMCARFCDCSRRLSPGVASLEMGERRGGGKSSSAN